MSRAGLPAYWGALAGAVALLLALLAILSAHRPGLRASLGADFAAAPPAGRIKRDLITLSTATSEAWRRVRSLHPYHLTSLDEHALPHAERVLNAGRAEAGEVEWLDALAAKFASAAEEERRAITLRRDTLRRLLSPSEGVDALLLATGAVKEGAIDRETDSDVTLRFIVDGVEGRRTYRRDEIKEIRRGRGATAEFEKRFESASGNSLKLTALMEWCRSHHQRQAAAIVATEILFVDPGHETARRELGCTHVYSIGFNRWRWIPAVETDGKGITVDGVPAGTLAEVDALVEPYGYSRHGEALLHRDPWIEHRAVRRSALVQSVMAGATIRECKLRAAAELDSGAVSVSVVTQDGRRQELYRIEGRGRAGPFVDITPTVRGASSFDIEVTVLAPPDPAHGTDAIRLLPRYEGEGEPLQIIGTCLSPGTARELNEALGRVQTLLK